MEHKRIIIIVCLFAVLIIGGVTLNPHSRFYDRFLPGDLFYGLKVASRSLRVALSSGVGQKAMAVLVILGEERAEIAKIIDRSDSGSDPIIIAVEHYAQSLERLDKLVSLISSQDLLDVGLLEKFAQTALTHNHFFVRTASLRLIENEKFQEMILKIRADLFDLTRLTPDTKEGTDVLLRAADEFWGNNRDDAFASFELAEFSNSALSRIGVDVDEENGQSSIHRAQENFLIDFAGTFQGAATSTREYLARELTRSAPNLIQRLALIDEAREYASDADAKTELTLLRQRVFQSIQSQHPIGEREAVEAVAAATEVASGVAAYISEHEGNVARVVIQSRDRINFQLEQAEKFYASGNYPSAFSQATAARIAAQNVLSPLIVTAEELKIEIEDAKSRYDELQMRVRGRLEKSELIDEKALAMLTSAEQKILSVSKSVESGAGGEKILPTIRTIKMLLATASEMLRI